MGIFVAIPAVARYSSTWAWPRLPEVGVHEKHAPLEGVWQDVVVVERLLPANGR